MTAELARTQSNQWLRDHSVEINHTLPVIESPEELRPLNAQAVAGKSMLLCHVIGIGYGGNTARLRNAVTDFGLIQYASEAEVELLGREKHSDQEKTNAMWVVECVQAFAWSLGLVASLDPFRRCDDDLAKKFPPPFSDPTEFISGARLRSFEEVYQQADLHYCLHWAARNARLMRKACSLHEGMIWERRRALDWAMGVGADWDHMNDST